jgi:hypothetical protein
MRPFLFPAPASCWSLPRLDRRAGQSIERSLGKPRLSIVIPYRGRVDHLRQFVPHVSAYFTRDKNDGDIPYRVLVVEQEPGLPFNRGALKNIGFLLSCDSSDYICFHDVDYLPMWADYSSVEAPTPIVWYGAESTPVAPGRSNRAVNHVKDEYFGGAVLFPNEAFGRIDGYATDYWGWGFEDSDLRNRLIAAGIPHSRRLGTFLPLHHDNEGFRVEGGPSHISKVNRAVFDGAWTNARREPRSGVSTVSFDARDRRPIALPPYAREAPWEIVTVRLNMQPSPEQMAAQA